MGREGFCLFLCPRLLRRLPDQLQHASLAELKLHTGSRHQFF